MITSQLDKNIIVNRILEIRKKIEYAALKSGRKLDEINLMAVTKNVSADLVNVAINSGVKLLGENRAQELNSKYYDYNLDNVDIHFIGHLQKNKIKTIINKVSMIESVDSEDLAREIGKHAIKNDKIMPILLEVNIGMQQTKTGFYPDKVLDHIKIISNIPGVKIRGLMVIPPKENVMYYFEKIRDIYIDISHKKIDNVNMDFLSMGMSGDFEKAISCGSNIVRIGNLMFGSRY